MTKYYNPLAQPSSVKSQSANKEQVESTSATFNVDNPNFCPKCGSANVPTQLLSNETVMFCTSCRVSLAIPLK